MSFVTVPKEVDPEASVLVSRACLIRMMLHKREDARNCVGALLGKAVQRGAPGIRGEGQSLL
eukprot:5590618-Alexandrium_andersonii.AAC.1